MNHRTTTHPATAEPAVLVVARDWLRECAADDWPDLEPDEVADLSDARVLAGVERHWAGGLAAFTHLCRDAIDDARAALAEGK